ncbi:unnamed protein product [Parascedosporium putredinis]|uniref:Uncharacterized protein n=1 Tax=Parascedosporium putredinis TaxID=1442378 RepID=A0A9P1GWV9_9PEZI|nr:unnamed protein product [Parascedosporium putredinis]CAI7988614.1 unnamed protein product [Parascedosporium putredinis]
MEPLGKAIAESDDLAVQGRVPFLKKSSPATLRALSTVVRPQAAATAASSPCGGTMSKLQLYANRCPIMGKAIAVRSAHYGRADMPKRSAVAGLRAFNSASKAGLSAWSYSGPTPPSMYAAPGAAPAPTDGSAKAGRFNYEAFYTTELDKKHKDKSYRYFNNINRLAKEFPAPTWRARRSA